MGCHYHKHTDGKKYFIPDCWGSVIWGKDRCTCYTVKTKKLNPSEYINHLEEENKNLKQKLKQRQNGIKI